VALARLPRPGNITLLTSQWKSGKTTLIAVLLSRLKAGGQLAGLPVLPGRAVWSGGAAHWYLLAAEAAVEATTPPRPGPAAPAARPAARRPSTGRGHGDERGLAGFPLAGQQRDVAGARKPCQSHGSAVWAAAFRSSVFKMAKGAVAVVGSGSGIRWIRSGWSRWPRFFSREKEPSLCNTVWVK